MTICKFNSLKERDMDLYALPGKQVRITTKDGDSFIVTIECWEGWDNDDGEYIETITFTRDGIYQAIDDKDIETVEILA